MISQANSSLRWWRTSTAPCFVFWIFKYIGSSVTQRCIIKESHIQWNLSVLATCGSTQTLQLKAGDQLKENCVKSFPFSVFVTTYFPIILCHICHRIDLFEALYSLSDPCRYQTDCIHDIRPVDLKQIWKRYYTYGF